MKFLVTLFDMCWVCNLSQFFVLTKKNRRNRTDVPSIRHEISKRKIRKFVCEFWFRCHFRHTKALRTRRLLMTALTRLKFFLKNIQRKKRQEFSFIKSGSWEHSAEIWENRHITWSDDAVKKLLLEWRAVSELGHRNIAVNKWHK